MIISSQKANRVTQKRGRHGVVVPTSIMRKFYTVGVVYHNPNSTIVSDSFHGTGISLINTGKRTGDFNLYVQCLLQLLPWIFVLDHGNAPGCPSMLEI
ncbi:hypothetical protein PoB_003607500 [Plakobranchus ocellatus]|uniref:Uncharacterized protein n=1 Tax=Plakobranchus ocellatus TaxID=259542 RepID=A0AAV4ARS0_9GAST|nr:hypothetical protein PoB_003607500 [Plakobranchus ocellatus]